MKISNTHIKICKIHRGQIQLGETIAVTIIVVILIVVGIVFWKNVQGQDIKTISKKSEDLSIIELAKTVAELPELKCYQTNIVTKVNCFDWYKILALNESMNDPATHQQTFDFYYNYFKTSKITFQQIYPDEINVTIYDNNITYKTKLDITIPIIIERRFDRTGIKSFGIIIVEGYYK